ncbi:acetyltransferase (GNAT) family protein [Desulfosporosinus acididurans]|uniref:Acetyltransferase (GNAT) family protein n=1 Tax=Desulfosporosinus acididurans TaxID=476652 RepID=A0A0J1FWK3_9FIRM|nr:GNAT family N-acetyltransferase [Desulfosporosinus acididurans]KLU67795.1 acetyltransferase (GNAT) family protein [Desulfosporosinus acididurans]
MESLRMSTLERIQLPEMVEVWNRCWQGYYYNMAYTPEHMKFWLELGQVELANSIAIWAHNQIVGFSLLAVNDLDGWIAGTSIDPKYRGKGLFKPLMKAQIELAQRLGLERVYLEVLVQNHAQKVYRSIGFSVLRQLYVYRTVSQENVPLSALTTKPFKEIPLTQYFAKRLQANFIPAWQRRQGYLERYRNIQALMNADGSAGILTLRQNSGPILDVWSSNTAGAEGITSMIVNLRKQGFILLNQPEDWIVAFLQINGVYAHARQYEMCLELE